MVRKTYIKRISPRTSSSDQNFNIGIHHHLALEDACLLSTKFKGEWVVWMKNNSVLNITHLDGKMLDPT